MTPLRPIVICTARYSDNLGDGVIAECIEYILKKVCPDLKVFHLDIAGRNGYVELEFQKTHKYKKFFYTIPVFVRSFAVLLAWPVLMLPKLRNALRMGTPNEPFNLIFGGGQILSDVALNFPLKFHTVSMFVAKRGSIIAVNAIGVSDKWSFLAKWLFKRSLTSPNVVSISVRDQQSYKNLCQHLTLNTQPHITIDSGIFAEELYGTNVEEQSSEKLCRIGIGIAHPSEMATQAENPDHFAIDAALNFWHQVIEGVRSAGYTPVLFSNGAFEDESFLEMVRSYLPYDIDYMLRPSTPEKLAHTIAGFRGIISHRLHANIVAFSFGIPAVALVWDNKVRAFAEVAGNKEWCLSSDATPQQIVSCLQRRLECPIDKNHLASLKHTVEQDIRSLLRSMQYIP